MPKYVDYFINKDPLKLEKAINHCFSLKKNKKSFDIANLNLLKRLYGII